MPSPPRLDITIVCFDYPIFTVDKQLAAGGSLLMPFASPKCRKLVERLDPFFDEQLVRIHDKTYTEFAKSPRAGLDLGKSVSIVKCC